MKKLFVLFFLLINISLFAVPYGEYKYTNQIIIDGEMNEIIENIVMVIVEGSVFIDEKLEAKTGEVVTFQDLSNTKFLFKYSEELSLYTLYATDENTTIIMYFTLEKEY